MIPAEVALIDFDIFCYKYGFGYEKKTYAVMDGDNIFEEFKYKKEASKVVKDMAEQGIELTIESYVKPDPIPLVYGCINSAIAGIMEKTGTKSYKGFLTGKGNYRNQLATINTYKKSRKDSPKPFHYQTIKDFLIEHHGAILVEGIEADDALGIAQDPEGSTVICSIDKDLRITPGRHFNLTSEELDIVDEFGEVHIVIKVRTVNGKKTNVKELKGCGKKFHYAQIIMGDSTDDIPGIPGRADVTAFEALDSCDTEEQCYEAVKRFYEEHYGEHWLPLLVQVARLLWIQQHEHQVWLPPGVEEL